MSDARGPAVAPPAHEHGHFNNSAQFYTITAVFEHFLVLSSSRLSSVVLSFVVLWSFVLSSVVCRPAVAPPAHEHDNFHNSETCYTLTAVFEKAVFCDFLVHALR